MGAEDKMKDTASDLARGVKEATGDVAAKAREVVEGLSTGDVAAKARGVVEGLLPGERGERAPDPAGTGAAEPAAQEAAGAPTDSATSTLPPASDANTSEDNLREISPEPGNRAGVRDTAGDRADHG